MSKSTNIKKNNLNSYQFDSSKYTVVKSDTRREAITGRFVQVEKKPSDIKN